MSTTLGSPGGRRGRRRARQGRSRCRTGGAAAAHADHGGAAGRPPGLVLARVEHARQLARPWAGACRLERDLAGPGRAAERGQQGSRQESQPAGVERGRMARHAYGAASAGVNCFRDGSVGILQRWSRCVPPRTQKWGLARRSSRAWPRTLECGTDRPVRCRACATRC